MDEEKRKAYIAASFGSSPKKRCEDADRINAARPVVDEKYLTKLEKSGISVVTREDFQYPHSFLDLYEPPVLFYAKGDLALLETTCVTVVGTRRATRYGVEATEYFAKGLAEAGVTIVSGLASGIDAIAHKAALKCGGKTIGIAACGLDKKYPPENAELIDEVGQNGLLLSEYPLGTPPLAFRFPERNRLLAAISKGVLVTEAGVGSGALITADLALDLGRELWLVPGSIFSRSSEGCNERLKECGRLVTRIGDIIYDTGGKDDGLNRTQIYTPEEQKLIDILEREGRAHYTAIAANSDLSIEEVAKLLMKMELDGKVRRLSGNYYVVANYGI